MTYIDNHPNFFRVLLAAVTAGLLAVGSVTLYEYASAPTDENIFTTPPSRFYVVKSFPASVRREEGGTSGGRDSILAGDLLTEIDGEDAARFSHVASVMDRIRARKTISLEVLRLANNRRLFFIADSHGIPDSFLTKLRPTAWVTEVPNGGTSDRAGMKVGDLIVRVNGLEFQTIFEADSILRSGEIGKALDYDILRGNRNMTLNVILAECGLPLSILLIGLTGLLCLGLGLFLVLKRPRIRAARLVGSSLIFIGFSFGIGPMQKALPFPAVLGLTTLLGLALLVHSYTFFPYENHEVAKRRWTQVFPYVYIGSVAILARILNIPQLFYLIALLVIYLLILRIVFRKGITSEQRRSSRALKIGTGITAAAFVLGITVFDGKLIWLTVIAACTLAFPLSYFYTIWRYHLLDLQFRVRRNIQYTFVTALWVLVITVIALKIFFTLPDANLHLPNIVFRPVSIEVTGTPLQPEQRDILEKLVLMAMAIALTGVFWKIGKVGQRIIDRKYYRAQYDYRRAAAELSEVLSTKLGMVDLARGVVEKVAHHMQIKKAGVVFFRDQRVCCCQEAYGFEGNVWNAFCFYIDETLVDALKKFEGTVRIDYFPDKIKAAFRQHGILHTVPIRSKEKLIGALLIGEKLSESTLSQEDIAFLESTARQTSVAIENAFLYEELAEQERLKHELKIARRIQLASLPQNTPLVAGLDISGSSVPAMEVGGDFYDYLNGQAEKVTVIVGDVSGKGTSAALYMSKVQGILRSLHEFKLSPSELLVRANQLLSRELEPQSFVTILGAELDVTQKRMKLVRGGHLPLFIYRQNANTAEKMTPRGIGLGLDENGQFAARLEECVVSFGEGDVLLFVTDGVTEARNSLGEEYGDERLLQTLKSLQGGSASTIREFILTDVKHFLNGIPQHDDQTVVVVKAL